MPDGKPITATRTAILNDQMSIFDAVVIASGGITVTLPVNTTDGHQCTVVRSDTGSAITVAASGADLISLAGATAASRSLNTNGASITMSYFKGVWYVTATQGTVA